jgi:nicotinamide-nucleotide amidase
MPVAEIIAIGTELLLGEIQDTNTQYLLRSLRDEGIDLFRTTMIGDNPQRIAAVIKEAASRSQIVITTGGLGPTIDDPTREAAALAAVVETEFRPELWNQIQERFTRYNRTPTANNRRQAFIPAHSHAIENPVGTAPAFWLEINQAVIICLPGVPREMEYLIKNSVIPFLRERFKLKGIIKAYILHASGVGESQLDEWVSDLEKNQNPTIGLSAHPGQIDIRITAKADSIEEADNMLQQTAQTVRARIGDALYGEGEDTLEGAAAKKLLPLNDHIAMEEHATDGEIIRLLKTNHVNFVTTKADNLPLTIENLSKAATELLEYPGVDTVIVSNLVTGDTVQRLQVLLLTPKGQNLLERTYGGPYLYGITWAVNSVLDLIRRALPGEL